MDQAKDFLLEIIPESIARRIRPGYQRPVKGNVAASIIRLIIFILTVQYFIVRPYMVPTGSMKRTIEEYDLLLVNRFIYGIRTPDNLSIPFTNYYFVRNIEPVRFTPELRSINSGDVIVFRADHEEPPVEYVKRCVAVAGQTVEMQDGVIYINGEAFENAPAAITSVPRSGSKIDAQITRSALAYNMFNRQEAFSNGIRYADDFDPNRSNQQIIQDLMRVSLQFTATFKHDYETDPQFRANLNASITEARNWRQINQGRFQTSGETYEFALFDGLKAYFASRQFAHITEDTFEFDPIRVPKKGDILNVDSVHFDILSNVVYYDGHTMDIVGGQIFIDGEKVNSYTVEQDYYFVIGDNRGGSLDSRAWGFVPRKYISGSPILIYFSIDESGWSASKSFIGNFFSTFRNIRLDRIGQMVL